MGKGLIKSHIGDGQYSVEIKMNQSFYEKRKAMILDNITELETQLQGEWTLTERRLIELKIKSLELSLSNLTQATKRDYTIAAWCADKTEDLTGDIATVEVPGESTSIQVAPGSQGTAAYTPARDGQLCSTMAMPSTGAFYNLAMLPGWQKWKPTFRYATITEIDSAESTVDLDMTSETSSQQNLNINQTDTISSVPVEYMTCDTAAFTKGDTVLVKFENQNWDEPKVVGFKDHPKGCGAYVMVFSDWLTVIWNITEGLPAEATWDVDGKPVKYSDWPVDRREISIWLDNYQRAGENYYEEEYCQAQTPDDGVHHNCFFRGDCFILDVPPLAYGASDSYSINEEVETVVDCPKANGDKANNNILIWDQSASHKWTFITHLNLWTYTDLRYKKDATLEYDNSGLGRTYTPIPNDSIEPRSMQVSVKGTRQEETYNEFRDGSGTSTMVDIVSEMIGIKSPFDEMMCDTTYNTTERHNRVNDPGVPGGAPIINEDYRVHKSQMAGSMRTKVMGWYTEKVVVQLWYSAGLTLITKDMLSNDNRWLGWKWSVGEPIETYDVIHERVLHATAEIHEDTTVVNPFHEPRDNGFEDLVLVLIDKLKENEDDAWHMPGTYDEKMPFTPKYLEMEILE